MTPDEQDQNLPATQQGGLPDVAFGTPEGFEAPQDEQLELRMSLDHKERQLKVGGVGYAKLYMLFMVHTEERILFNDPNPHGPDKRVACSSWDGVHAYGQGGRVPKGQQPDFQPRQCGEWQAGRFYPKCPMAEWEGKSCPCPPRLRILAMASDAGDAWFPVMFEVAGKAVTQVKRQIAALRNACAIKRAKGYEFMFEVEVVPDGQNANLKFGSPTKLDMRDPGTATIAQFLHVAPDVWREELERGKVRALDLDSRWEESKQGG